jgi:hypothetical protein
MLNYFKSKWHVATASLLLSVVATSVHADNESAQMRNLDNRVTALEQRKMPNGVITPSARPPVRDSVDIGIALDALYAWTTQGGDYPGTIGTTSGVILESGALTQKLGPKGNWGGRAVLNYTSCHDDWEIDLGWTFFQSKLKNNVAAAPGEWIYPNYTNPSAYYAVYNYPLASNETNLTYESMNSRSNVQFNDVALGLNRPSYLSKNLAVNLGVALEAVWLLNKYHTTYNNLYFNSAFLPTSGYELMGRSSAYGIGATMRVGTDWYLTKNLSIFGSFEMGALWTYHKVSRTDTFTPGSSNPAVPSASTGVMARPHTNNFHSDSKLGVEWAGYIAEDRYRYSLRVCWEQWLFMGFNQRLLFTGAQEAGKMFTNQGDYSMQGITFGAGLDF